MSASPSRVSPMLAARLYNKTAAARWGLPVEQFRATLEACVEQTLAAAQREPPDLERHLSSLQLDDLALASACAAGLEAAWEHFVQTHRPGLYRAADAIDPTGGARDLADAIHADLFGLRERDGVRQSLFRYFHGRSSLATWLRAVLSQRHIDRLRAGRRLDPLPEDDSVPATAAQPGLASRATADPERPRFVEAMRQALAASIARLAARDRLRLKAYYAQDMTLAAIGRLLGEHEATVSRHLTRTRRAIRDDVDAQLRRDHGLDDDGVGECFRSVIEDAGSLNLEDWLGAAVGVDAGGKIAGQDRSR